MHIIRPLEQTAELQWVNALCAPKGQLIITHKKETTWNG
jgi:hypothetical protein